MPAKNRRANALSRFGRLQDGTELHTVADEYEVPVEEVYEDLGFLAAAHEEIDPLADDWPEPEEDYEPPYDDREEWRGVHDMYDFFDLEPPTSRSFAYTD